MSKKKGQWAEYFAVWVLRLKGYRIMARNFLPPNIPRYGEIDIIARKGSVLVFVEVKYRHHPESLKAAMHPRQWQRIATSATAYVARRPHLQKHKWRFDEIWVSVNISLNIRRMRLFFRHHQNMWHM